MGNVNRKCSPEEAQRIPGIKYIKLSFCEGAVRAMLVVSPECAALLPGYACFIFVTAKYPIRPRLGYIPNLNCILMSKFAINAFI
jgi:hypothetical protein